MGMFTTAVAFGAGYALGRPGGRAQVQSWLKQARELTRHPEVKRVRERGWDVAGEQVAAAKRRFDARSRPTDTRPADTAALSQGTLPPGPAA